MSVFDQLAGLIPKTEQEAAVQDEAEDAPKGSVTTAQPLTEMMGYGCSTKRYLNPRDLQYALEDAKTTCTRMWNERKRFRDDTKDMAGAHNKLQKALQAAAEAARAYADAQDDKVKKLRA